MPTITLSQNDLDDILQHLSDRHDEFGADGDQEVCGDIDRLCGALRNTTPVRVMVDFSGGAIHSVISDHPAEVVFTDEDHESVNAALESPAAENSVMPVRIAEGVEDDSEQCAAYWRRPADVDADSIDGAFAYLNDDARRQRYVEAVEADS